MFKTSQRFDPILSPSLKDDKKIGSDLIKFEGDFQKIEQRFKEEAIENVYYRSLITLALGKEFSERVLVSENEVNRFTLLYSTDSKEVQTTTYRSIIPLQKEGFEWNSPQSSSLRKKYKINADRMFERLDLCNFGESNFESGKIELTDIPYKTIDYLEFSSAAALVDKKSRKRKEHNSGDSVYFRDFYSNGQRGMLFALFDGICKPNTDTDSKSSSFLLSIFKKYFSSVDFNPSKEEEIYGLFNSFVNYAEKEGAKYDWFSGASFSIGIVFMKNLYYLNLGDCRIYSISFSPEVSVSNVTIDDGLAGVISKGAKIDIEEFFSQIQSPQMYLGAFSQRLSGKGKRVLDKINLKYPNMGKISLENSNFILACSDGLWSNLPFMRSQDNILDASGKQIIELILEKASTKNPKQIIEILYSYAKNNMKLKSTAKFKNSIIRPNNQDIGILGFSI